MNLSRESFLVKIKKKIKKFGMKNFGNVGRKVRRDKCGGLRRGPGEMKGYLLMRA